ncbi:MAG: hypothetical protein EA361_10820 [Bacteroidetes bacterium]|nr:MAG: hypothetical protein EA361_10820 [Bacteroidota bacterium]
MVCSTVTFGQTTFYAEGIAGYTFSHRTFYLGQEYARNINGASFSLGSRINVPISHRWSFQTGVYGMGIAVTGRVGFSEYTSRSLKIYIPFLAGININDQIKLSAGGGIRNNKDLKMFHIRGSHNIRFDMNLRMDYQIGNRLNLMLSLHQNAGLPKVYLLNDPSLHIQTGVSYRLFSKSDRPLSGDKSWQHDRFNTKSKANKTSQTHMSKSKATK